MKEVATLHRQQKPDQLRKTEKINRQNIPPSAACAAPFLSITRTTSIEIVANLPHIYLSILVGWSSRGLSRELSLTTPIRVLIAVDSPNLDLGILQPPVLLIPLSLLPPGKRRDRVRLEPEAPGRVALVALLRDQGGVNLEQDVGERGSKVGAVDRGVAR